MSHQRKWVTRNVTYPVPIPRPDEKMSMTGMRTIGSVINGVKIGICWEVGIDRGNRTNGSGRKGGISSRFRVGFSVRRPEDDQGAEPARREERGVR